MTVLQPSLSMLELAADSVGTTVGASYKHDNTSKSVVVSRAAEGKGGHRGDRAP